MKRKPEDMDYDELYQLCWQMAKKILVVQDEVEFLSKTCPKVKFMETEMKRRKSLITFGSLHQEIEIKSKALCDEEARLLESEEELAELCTKRQEEIYKNTRENVELDTSLTYNRIKQSKLLRTVSTTKEEKLATVKRIADIWLKYEIAAGRSIKIDIRKIRYVNVF